MEDVEERRRRLAAMREEAASQGRGIDLGSLPSTNSPAILSNPFDDSADDAAADDSGRGFDFYTDPLAGFSGSKRRRAGLGLLPLPQSINATPQTPVRIMNPPSLLQPPSPHPPPGPSSWQHIEYQPPLIHPPPGTSSWQPIEYQPPLIHPAFAQPHHPPQFHPQMPPPYYTNQWSNQPSHEFFNQTSGRGQDRGFGGRYYGRHSPIGSGRGDLSGEVYSPSRRGGGRGNLSGGSPSGGSWSNGSRSDSGGSWRNGSRSEGGGSHGRGQRGGRIASANDQPGMFFKRSMLEDPWQALEATVVERT